MKPEERIEYVAAQLKAVRENRTNTVTCPYCDASVLEGEPICCMTMAKAMEAVLHRWDEFEGMDLAARIADKVFAEPTTKLIQ